MLPIYICIYIYTNESMNIFVYINVYTYVCVFQYLYTYIYIYIYIHSYTWFIKQTHICIYTYIYIHITGAAAYEGKYSSPINFNTSYSSSDLKPFPLSFHDNIFATPDYSIAYRMIDMPGGAYLYIYIDI